VTIDKSILQFRINLSKKQLQNPKGHLDELWRAAMSLTAINRGAQALEHMCEMTTVFVLVVFYRKLHHGGAATAQTSRSPAPSHPLLASQSQNRDVLFLLNLRLFMGSACEVMIFSKRLLT
jgi:hypothetical protein